MVPMHFLNDEACYCILKKKQPLSFPFLHNSQPRMSYQVFHRFARHGGKKRFDGS